MLEIKIGDIIYEFSCKLGVTRKIKNKFQQPFNQVVQKIGELDIPELIKFLHAALVDDEIKYKDFEENVYDNLGVMELNEAVLLLIKKIQYPNLTEEEIDEKLKNM